MLLAGIAFSLLLGLLMFVLGTGRERARRQLEQRTGELHHQALHDALTGLPNRALVMDRIEQLLVRDRRNRTTGAVLFLDLDDFKNVNDTLGHGAGDRLLIAVANRLSSTLRGVDTIGRMGGDEFVVLIDGDSARRRPRTRRRTTPGRDAPTVRTRRHDHAADRQHQHRYRHRRPGQRR